MSFQGLTYLAADTPIHRADARVKVLGLLAFSIGIFFVQSWWGMAACVLLVGVFAAVARIPAKRLVGPAVPVILLAAFAVLFAVIAHPDVDSLSAALLVAVRMILLVVASLIVSYTTTSTGLLRAFSWIIGPLRHVRVPVDDIAFTLSLALRFIPVIAAEFEQVRKAQLARGAALDGLPLRRKLEVWGAAFAAVFIGAFRRAASLADAMDARCYGAAERRTSL